MRVPLSSRRLSHHQLERTRIMLELSHKLQIAQSNGTSSALLGLPLAANPFEHRSLASASWRKGWFLGDNARRVGADRPQMAA